MSVSDALRFVFHHLTKNKRHSQLVIDTVRAHLPQTQTSSLGPVPLPSVLVPVPVPVPGSWALALSIEASKTTSKYRNIGFLVLVSLNSLPKLNNKTFKHSR